jgi:hypothetical protein
MASPPSVPETASEESSGSAAGAMRRMDSGVKGSGCARLRAETPSSSGPI